MLHLYCGQLKFCMFSHNNTNHYVVASTQTLILSLAHAGFSFISLGHIAVRTLLIQCLQIRLQICNHKCVVFQNE